MDTTTLKAIKKKYQSIVPSDFFDDLRKDLESVIDGYADAINDHYLDRLEGIDDVELFEDFIVVCIQKYPDYEDKLNKLLTDVENNVIPLEDLICHVLGYPNITGYPVSFSSNEKDNLITDFVFQGKLQGVDFLICRMPEKYQHKSYMNSLDRKMLNDIGICWEYFIKYLFFSFSLEEESD